MSRSVLKCSSSGGFGLTLGLGRSLMHGVAPQMCGRVASPLLGRGAGGRSPGYLAASVGGPEGKFSTCQRERGALAHFEAEYLAVVCNFPPIANHSNFPH